MIYSESLQKAAEIAKKALAELKANDVPANPQNFSIWYEYEAGRNPELASFIDRARDQGEKLTPASCREIYDRFFTLQGGEADGWSSRIQEAANQIIDSLENAGHDTEQYEAALLDFSGPRGQVEQVPGRSRVRKLMPGHCVDSFECVAPMQVDLLPKRSIFVSITSV